MGAKFGRGRDWGAERLKEIRAQDDVSRSELADSEQLRTEARAEARRARDAGEPYFGMALGAKFGMSAAWGWWRLQEIKNEGGNSSRAELEEREREAGRAEARRARDAGEPHSGRTLGEKFGKSKGWGTRRLNEIFGEESAQIRTISNELEREAARVEARRARDAGQPYSSRALGEKFGKGKDWGLARLDEIDEEFGVSRTVAEQRTREAARAEARRARDAGETYTTAALGKKFGKGRDWGAARLREIRNEAGDSAGGASGSRGGVSTKGVGSGDVAVSYTHL